MTICMLKKYVQIDWLDRLFVNGFLTFMFFSRKSTLYHQFPKVGPLTIVSMRPVLR